MKYLHLIVLLLVSLMLNAQQTVNDTISSVFYYQNGQKSSEGFLVNNKPDGYWKTFYESGLLKSEGNRKNFELDSVWKFYDESGVLSLEINYKSGRKDGARITYLPTETIRENFELDIKKGWTSYEDTLGRLVKNVPFENGLEQGIAYTYDTIGNIIELTTYKKGYVIDRERINRLDSENRAQGVWKWFYDSGIVKMEGTFKNGLKNGLFKTYDLQGNLKKIEKYIDNVRQDSAEEVAKLDLRRDYYPDGKIKVEATYRQGVPEGIRREFDANGEVEQSYIFRNGKIIGQGIINLNGLKQGLWKDYYPDGTLKSQGNYTDGVQVDAWEFYYPKGELEQRGTYNDKGKPNGKWTWYFSNGSILREEIYRNGLRDGLMTEYNSEGTITAQGDFIDGKEEGFWVFQTGQFREEGEFVEGYLNGLWKHYFEDGKLAFSGSFVDDLPNGKHTYYYQDGSEREEGSYLMGRKNGEWKKWNEDKTLIITITYVNGIERSYDGINIPDDEIDMTE